MSCKRTLRQAGSYLFYSVLTTLVNWLAYSGCMRLLQSIDVSHQTGMVFLANTLSWVAAVTFAFFVNKLRVFRSRSWRMKTLVPELIGFFATRIAVGTVEIVLVPLLVALGLDQPLWGVDGMVSKILITPILILLNFLCGKWIVFRKAANEEPPAAETVEK